MTPETEEQVLLSLGRIEACMETLAEKAQKVETTVDKHERVYNTGKVLWVPVALGLHLGLSAIWKKILHM